MQTFIWSDCVTVRSILLSMCVYKGDTMSAYYLIVTFDV